MEVEFIPSGAAAETGVTGGVPTLKDDFHLPAKFGEIVLLIILSGN